MGPKNILIIILLILPFIGFAQLAPPSPSPGPPPPPPGLPIDGFSGALLALGVIYGVRKKYKDSSS
ncbi:hypothetical protein JL193_15340 [Polaribacter batillariae]|uniref:PEP-CTERM sorting domain-containing protein n=1 Tax=Polaribacter batillariae TaxID=2808900 RepID=A0ABX7SVT3_9FLAO|nr:hypothetical protein [Polaribacter batillariae]QTD37443.1 hypothetical protein JL193_15340 [Polaribacter batillariae]